ncbi:uncharacterized protein F5891DRAFT_983961 [Suillus fuscotomentosus]|uniref:Uncharacterized protein n=1 Tax=Suillus fuscotomentosus TaxID=1912939 RepID=A0AAD4HGL9_9AGAM|nr:uncharacterized protein F5891DRAFT_983961 [Suillus fuscotomentosus]KAG1895782.1 hypothetical protein F5891DRAFT_983961 [Suillus fuscotomentosus]
MPESHSRKHFRPSVRVGNNVTIKFQLSSHVEELRSDDCKQIKLLVHSGTQTIYADEESKSELEDELRRVKEQLRSAEDNIAYLSERMKTYRYRWIEDYHRAENLELHMPYGTYVPDLDQIPEGAASPKLFLE